jgi:TetR/AcrR family transcriptional repressor of nem operon
MGIGGASLYKRPMATSASWASGRWNATPTLDAGVVARSKPGSSLGKRSALSRPRSSTARRSPDRKGCLLVNSALDVAPHDPEIGKLVADYLGEIRAFFKRNLEAARHAGQVHKRLDAEAVSAHLLGVVLGIRVLARTGAKRKLLESVARPALDLLDGAAGPAGRRNTP